MDVDEQAEILRRRLHSFCEAGFDGSIPEAALVLGRDGADIEEMLDGDLPIDEDLEMKMSGIAEERGISIDGDASRNGDATKKSR